jgi:hypothetical protein
MLVDQPLVSVETPHDLLLLISTPHLLHKCATSALLCSAPLLDDQNYKRDASKETAGQAQIGDTHDHSAGVASPSAEKGGPRGQFVIDSQLQAAVFIPKAQIGQ